MQSDNHSTNIKPISILAFSGEDATNFLQGQLSNDINALSSSWQYSGYCNPKGRLIALFQLWRHGDIIYGAIDQSLAETVIKRLRMYVMRSKVKIEEIKCASYAGIIDQELTSARFVLEYSNSLHTLHLGGRALLVDLEGSLRTSTSSEWAQAAIQAGEPTIDINNTELFVPQMVNLDLLEGINFKKGCYTGQEIVARMHYLGKLKQRMFVCEVTGETVSGDKIISQGKSAGNIVTQSNQLALAVIRNELIESKLVTESGAILTPVKNQPHAIE